VGCSERTAKRAIDAAEKQGLIGQRADKFYELLDKSQIVSKGSPYSPCHHCHQKLSSVNGDNSVMTPVDTNDTNREVSQVSGSKGWHYCHQLGSQVCAFCGNKLSEISATPTCPFCWATGEETVAHCICGEPLRWAGVGRALCPQCSKHWRWAGDHWEPDGDLPPDNGHEPDNEPAPTPTVTAARPPTNEPEDNGERYIDTESWVASFFEASNEPAVIDLETNEVTPVTFPDRPTKEAYCSRCGHREAVDPEVLLPPLCPACSAPMEWGSVPDLPDSSPNDPLIEALSRIANLSSQLETGGGQQ